MPYKRHQPVPESDMEKRMKGGDTLCNVIREMYHLTEDAEIRLKCRLAFSMGKAMCDQLCKYKAKYGNQSEYDDGI